MTKKSSKQTDETGFSFDSLASVHDDILDKSPDPNIAAIEAKQTMLGESTETREGQKDSFGTLFDPKLHAVDREGNPSKTSLGRYRKRRGLSKVSITSQQLVDAKKAKEKKESAQATGMLAADLLIGSCVQLLGDEWIPVGSDGKPQEAIHFDEHSNMRRAFGNYFEAKGFDSFPPWVELNIALTAYMVPRLVAGKETKTKLSKVRDWVSAKWKKWTKPKDKKDASQPDSRDNGKRENDTGEATVQPESPAATRHPRA